MLRQKTYNTNYLTKKRAKNNGDLPQYYYEDTHAALIDKNTWECVQLEFERQEQYCKEHYISRYHNSNEHFPFSGRVICGVCGSTYVLLGSKRLDEIGKKYWRCSSFHGNNGTVIEGKTFTPPPQHTKLDDGSPEARARAIRRKPPDERQMLCTDIQINAGEPDKAFISAWNELVERYESYVPVWEDIIQNSTDVLLRYRAADMLELVKETGRIERIDYRLVFRVLDHIKVGIDGGLEVVFLSGTGV